MTYAKWLEPKQYRMGYHGSERTPIYADCADCGEKEAVIAGDMRSADGQIGVMKIEGSAFVNLAVFCAPCFDKRWDSLIPAVA